MERSQQLTDAMLDSLMSEHGFGISNNEVRPLKPTIDLHIVAVIKDGERYVFAFDDAHHADAMRTAGRWACDPGLAFDWHMASIVSQKVRAACPQQ